MKLEFSPIGFFSGDTLYRYDVPRQGAVAQENLGVIKLEKEYEGTLQDLDGFSHIWVIYCFHQNHSWKPKIMPPRHRSTKVGVFASRSPYRPNPIGISAVKLIKADNLELVIADHDLLDGTPILDIKPYLKYADSFPDASLGWTAEKDSIYPVVFSSKAQLQIEWLEQHGVTCLRQFITTQLEYEPTNKSRHRLLCIDGINTLAYRTWRAQFRIENDTVIVQNIFSGYSTDELNSQEDKYSDKQIHREFLLLT